MKTTIYTYDTITTEYLSHYDTYISNDLNPQSVLSVGETLIAPFEPKDHNWIFFDKKENTWVEKESLFGKQIINTETKQIMRCQRHTCPEGYTADIPEIDKLPYLYWNDSAFVCDRPRLIAALYAKASSLIRKKCKEALLVNENQKIYIGKTTLTTLLSCSTLKHDVIILDNKFNTVHLSPETASALIIKYLDRKSQLSEEYAAYLENLDDVSDDELFVKLEWLTNEEFLLDTEE